MDQRQDNLIRLRNIGVIGYAGLYPFAAMLLAILFHRTQPRLGASVA